MQYTIRRIPKVVDAALRRRARAEGRSLNAVAVDALVSGSGATGHHDVRRDLTGVAGTWREDREMAAALRDQDRIDESLWK